MAPCPTSPRLAAAVSVLFFSAGALGQSASVLKEVRFRSGANSTRITLETSGEVNYKHDRLQNPDRLYIDLIDVRPNRAFRGLAYTVPVEDGIVKQVRVALNQRGVTRVVMDLQESSVTVKTEKLTNPDRVVVEVARNGAAAEPALSKAPPEPRTEPVSSAALKAPDPAPASTPAPVERPVAAQSRPAPKRFVAPPVIPAPPPPIFAIDASRLPRWRPAESVPDSPYLMSRVISLRPAPKAQLAAKLAPEPPPAAAAKPNRNGNHSLTRALGLKLNRVVLDAGHGGHDTGTLTPNGLVEKDLVLDVTLRLGRLLEERMGAEVVYTRDDDTFISLERRTQIANERKADLFLSIHANSSPYKTIVGSETYYLSFSGSQVDMEVAARENASSQKSIHELSDLVKKVMLNEKLDESREFAAKIQSASFNLAAQTHGAIRNRGVKKAPFVVLIGASMPSVLTEIGFMSNSKEEALLGKPEHRQKIAEALYKGMVSYTDTLSHFSKGSGAPATSQRAALKTVDGQ